MSESVLYQLGERWVEEKMERLDPDYINLDIPGVLYPEIGALVREVERLRNDLAATISMRLAEDFGKAMEGEAAEAPAGEGEK